MNSKSPQTSQATSTSSLLRLSRNIRELSSNGNGYDDAWVEEAKRRGLPNYVSTVDAVEHYDDEKNIKLFEEFKVLSKTEVESRREILLDNYSKIINIEALTMLDMAKKQIIPAAFKFSKQLADAMVSKKEIGVNYDAEKRLADKVSEDSAVLTRLQRLTERSFTAENTELLTLPRPRTR